MNVVTVSGRWMREDMVKRRAMKQVGIHQIVQREIYQLFFNGWQKEQIKKSIFGGGQWDKC